MRFRVVQSICVFLVVASGLVANDRIILQVASGSVRGGRSSFVAQVQEQINRLPAECRPSTALGVDGNFGPGSRAGIRKVAACAAFQSGLPPDSAARNGAITEAFWKLLFPDRALPTV